MKHWIRKFLPVLLIVSMLFTGASAMSAFAAELGDIDQDGSVNAADALKALQHAVQLITLTGEDATRADVSGDGKIDASDALLILQYAVKLIPGFSTANSVVSMPWSAGTKVYATETEATETDEIRTTFQQSGRYAGEMDVQSDSVMAYILDLKSVDSTFDSWAQNNQSGRQIDVMIAGGRDAGNEFFNLYPEREKKDAHRKKDGEYHYHPSGDFKTTHYMMPTTYYTEYKWTLVDAICKKNPGFIVIEEPEFFVSYAYNDGFYEEWENYYGSEFQDPTTSAEARYMASKLMAYMWTRMYTTIGERMAEKYPEIGLGVAAHSTTGYNGNIISAMNGYTACEYIDVVIGQTWSDTANAGVWYKGDSGTNRVFESAFFGYSTYPDSMQDGQVLYTLTDAKADNDSLTWERYEYLWQQTVVAELMQPEINHFQECVWPSRGFTVAPDDYRTIQLSIYNMLGEVGDYGSIRYAGTPGIYMGLSDSVTYQVHHMMNITTNPATDGISLPLIEKGIPLGVKALDHIDEASDLDGVKLLILAYDIQKPISEDVNIAIAEWVKAGGVLLNLGGRNDYDTVSGEWWTEKGQTPQENLFHHLGLDSIEIKEMAGYISLYEWVGSAGYGESFNGINTLSPLEMSYGRAYSGTGFTTIISNMDDQFGIDAKVGKGRLISVGLPTHYYGLNEKGPDQMRDLVEYACRYLDVAYRETDLMAIQRGPFVAAHALEYGGTQTMTGDFVDLFDASLPIISKKEIKPGDAALLYDLTELRKAGKPVMVHTGANLRSQVTETENTTTFTASGPTGTASASRFLGNGKTPEKVELFLDGQLYFDFVSLWDNATGSLLLKINHQADEELEVKITWGTGEVEDTPLYSWVSEKIQVNANNLDAQYVVTDTTTASRVRKTCEYGGQLIYGFDVNSASDHYFVFEVCYNYLVEISFDGETYQKVADYRDVSEEYVTSISNRTDVMVFPQLYGEGKKVYIRFSNTDPTKQQGTGVSSMTIHSKKYE